MKLVAFGDVNVHFASGGDDVVSDESEGVEDALGLLIDQPSILGIGPVSSADGE
jgi:hypothetical protein